MCWPQEAFVLLVLRVVKFHAFLPFCLWDKEVLISISPLNIFLCSQVLILNLIVIYAGFGTNRENTQMSRDNQSLSYIHKTNVFPWQPDWFRWSVPQLIFCNHQTLRKRVKGWQQTCQKQAGTAWERSSEVEPQCVRVIFLVPVEEKLIWHLCSASRLKHAIFCCTQRWRELFASVLQTTFSQTFNCFLFKTWPCLPEGKEKQVSAVK